MKKTLIVMTLVLALFLVIACDRNPGDANNAKKDTAIGQPKANVSTPVVAKQDFKIKIEYCTSWGYRGVAASLAAAIKQKYGVDSTLQKSSGGVFEVFCDNKLIFSKKKLGRFPTSVEILKILETKAKASTKKTCCGSCQKKACPDCKDGKTCDKCKSKSGTSKPKK